MLKNKALIITVLTVLIPLIFQLAFLRYVSYYVDKVIYGEYVILSTFVYGLSQVFLSIPSQSFNRFYNSASNKTQFINEFKTYLIFINLLCIIFFLLFFSTYGERFSNVTYILIYVLFVLLSNYTLNQMAFLLSLKRHIYFILKIFEASSKYLFPLIIYYLYSTLNSLICGTILGYCVSLTLTLYFLRKVPFRITINLENFKKYIKFSYPIIFSSIFSWSISFSDRFFIDNYLTSEDVAIYSILAQFSGFAQVLAMIYGTYVNPIILREYEIENKNGLKILRRYLIYFSAVLLVMFVFVLILPQSLLAFVIEEDVIFNDYYYSTFIILFSGIILTVLQTTLSMYFVLLNKLHVHARIFIFAATVNFVLNFFVADFGIIAAAVSTLVAYIMLNVLILLWITTNFKRIGI